jgi:multicomponent Na+:H+ antiporter subunit G
MTNIVAAIFLIIGAGFLVISALGLARFPDFWTRAHAVAKAETLGLVLMIVGLMVLNRFGPGTVQLGLIAVFSLMVNPTAIHALARAASRSGVPSDDGEPDDGESNPGEDTT